MKILEKTIFLSLLGCFSESLWAQDRKWVWKKIGDEISNYLIQGNGNLREDMHHPGVASSTHLSTFSPTYVAATIIEAALIPFDWSYGQIKAGSVHLSQSSEASSKKSFEGENEDLKKELERAREREKELNKRIQELINDQAEKFIDTYSKELGQGELAPELKRYLDQTRSRIFMSSYNLALGFGYDAEEAKRAGRDLNSRIKNLDLVKGFLTRFGEAI